jgi:hypothetical protein
MRYCVDCRFCTNQDKAGTGFTCDGGIFDLVTGMVRIIPCEEARMNWQCGPDGSAFKPRVESDLPLILQKTDEGLAARLERAFPARDLKRGRSDDDGPQRAEGGA